MAIVKVKFLDEENRVSGVKFDADDDNIGITVKRILVEGLFLKLEHTSIGVPSHRILFVSCEQKEKK